MLGFSDAWVFWCLGSRAPRRLRCCYGLVHLHSHLIQDEPLATPRKLRHTRCAFGLAAAKPTMEYVHAKLFCCTISLFATPLRCLLRAAESPCVPTVDAKRATSAARAQNAPAHWRCSRGRRRARHRPHRRPEMV